MLSGTAHRDVTTDEAHERYVGCVCVCVCVCVVMCGVVCVVMCGVVCVVWCVCVCKASRVKFTRMCA